MSTSIIYWTSTALLSALYFSSAALYLVKPVLVREAHARLGYAAPYLVPLMVVIKVAAPMVILWRFSVPLSDLAYAGVLYHLGLAAIAHIGAGKLKDSVPALMGLVLLLTSFATQNAVRDGVSPYALAHMSANARD